MVESDIKKLEKELAELKKSQDEEMRALKGGQAPQGAFDEVRGAAARGGRSGGTRGGKA